MWSHSFSLPHDVLIMLFHPLICYIAHKYCTSFDHVVSLFFEYELVPVDVGVFGLFDDGVFVPSRHSDKHVGFVHVHIHATQQQNF